MLVKGATDQHISTVYLVRLKRECLCRIMCLYLETTMNYYLISCIFLDSDSPLSFEMVVMISHVAGVTPRVILLSAGTRPELFYCHDHSLQLKLGDVPVIIRMYFKRIMHNSSLGPRSEISLRLTPQNLTYKRSTLDHAMAWCCQASSQYIYAPMFTEIYAAISCHKATASY